jgi:hypothetical protein
MLKGDLTAVPGKKLITRRVRMDVIRAIQNMILF